MNDILKNVTSSPAAIVSAALVVCVGLIAFVILLKSVSDGSVKLGQAVLEIFHHLARELGGKDAAPYERINGVMVVGLLLLAVLIFVLMTVQSIKGMTVGGELVDPKLLAALLVCMAFAAGTGLACVRFCGRHKDDATAAKRLSAKAKK